MLLIDQYTRLSQIWDILQANEEFELPSAQLEDINRFFKEIGISQNYDQITAVEGSYGMEYVGHTKSGELITLKLLIFKFKKFFEDKFRENGVDVDKLKSEYAN